MVHQGGRGGVRNRCSYVGKGRDPRAGHVSGIARARDRVRGSSEDGSSTHFGSSGESFGCHFGSRIRLSESHSAPERDLGVEQRRGRSFRSRNSKARRELEETNDAGPSQGSPRTVHTFAAWATTRFVPTRELRRERSFRVGACGRRPLESADPKGPACGAPEGKSESVASDSVVKGTTPGCGHMIL